MLNDSFVMLSVLHAERHHQAFYAEGHYAECRQADRRSAALNDRFHDGRNGGYLKILTLKALATCIALVKLAKFLVLSFQYHPMLCQFYCYTGHVIWMSQ